MTLRTSVNLSVARKGSFRDFGIDWVVFTRHSRNRFEQHVQGWISGSIASVVSSEFLFSSVDRNIVGRSSVASGSGSLVSRCDISACSESVILTSSTTSNEAASSATNTSTASSMRTSMSMEAISSNGCSEC